MTDSFFLKSLLPPQTCDTSVPNPLPQSRLSTPGSEVPGDLVVVLKVLFDRLPESKRLFSTPPSPSSVVVGDGGGGRTFSSPVSPLLLLCPQSGSVVSPTPVGPVRSLTLS